MAANATKAANVKYNKLRNPAYPASHPVNAQEFDPAKQGGEDESSPIVVKGGKSPSPTKDAKIK